MSEIDLSQYVILPETERHPDLLVAIGRSLFYLNHFDTKIALKEQDSFMLGFEFPEFLRILKSGERLFNGRGKLVGQDIKNKIFEDLTATIDSWRGERLDYLFTEKAEGFFVTSHNFYYSGELAEITELLDADTLMQTIIPGISLEGWKDNPTSQGLPRSNVPNGSLYYWPPEQNGVAWFYADADWAFLGCNGNPLSSDAFLGVRRAKIRRKAA